MKKIGEGHKSEVFLLPDGRILKLFFPHFAYLAAEEIGISQLLQRANVLAPRVDETTEVDGRPGIVFGNLKAGETLGNSVRRRPWQIVPLAKCLAQLHSDVHKCHSTELPAQRARLEGEIDDAVAVPIEIRRDALSILAELPDNDTVCHNDIHMLNVISHPDDPMIIDWALATRGNPLADVAAAVLQLRFGERPNGFLLRVALEAGRSVFWQAYRRHYLRLRPGQGAELARWELPVAVGMAGRREGRMQMQLINRIDELTGTNASRPAGARL